MTSLLSACALLLPAVALAGLPLAWLDLAPRERSALGHRAVVAVGLAVGLGSLTGRLPLDLTAYGALGAALVLVLRRRLGATMLVAAALGALARGDLAVHQRPGLVGGVVVGVLASVVGTVLWQLLDPLPRTPDAISASDALGSARSGWARWFAPSPIDLDHLDAIIDGPGEALVPSPSSTGRPATAAPAAPARAAARPPVTRPVRP